MPFDENARFQQTSAFAAAVLPTMYRSDPEAPFWTHVARQAHDLQALRCLILGLDLGFFEPTISARYADVLLRRLDERVLIGAYNELEQNRLVIDELSARFRERRYDAPTYPLEAAQIAFRTAILPVLRLRRVDGDALVLLDRAMFAPDWDEFEGRLAVVTLDDRVAGHRIPLVEALIGALRYLEAASSAVRTAYQWADFPHSLMRGELRTMYRLQFNPRHRDVKDRVVRSTAQLVRATVEEARRLFNSRDRRDAEEAEAVVAPLARGAEWEAEVSAIVGMYDDAVNGDQW